MSTHLIPDTMAAPDMRLGRHVNHDPRSRNYPIPLETTPVVSKTWRRYTPILDQGALGSCTGNAATGVLGSAGCYGRLAAQRAAGLTLDERRAVALYSAATQLDPWPGTYPPTDTGSDGTSVAKAAKAAGYISSYLHAFSFDDMVAALQLGPVIVGVNWYDSFDTPDSRGQVFLTSGAKVRGGHEFEVRAVNTTAKVLRATNSWSSSWGLGGEFVITFADMTRLLAEHGDCTRLVPLGVAA